MRLITWLALSFILTGCGGDDQGGAESSSLPVTSASSFDDDMSKKGCEILSTELVATTFEVPADALKQYEILGCRYSWDNEDQTLDAGLSMIRVYDNEAAAADWFASATRNKTAEEMQEEMAQVSRQLEKSEQLDTELKQSTAKSMLAMIGTKAIHFEDVAGIGDEARINNEGTIYVRVGNLTFMSTAYKGAMAPPLDMTGLELKDMAKMAKESGDRWALETAPQRKLDSTRLARAIVQNL